jgi:hypothetical protein
MTVAKLMGGLLLVTAIPAMAATSATIWEEDTDGQLRLEDSARPDR